jgi:hypothetical protein
VERVSGHRRSLSGGRYDSASRVVSRFKDSNVRTAADVPFF